MIIFWLRKYTHSFTDNVVCVGISVKLSHTFILQYKGKYINNGIYYNLGNVKIGMNLLTQGYKI